METLYKVFVSIIPPVVGILVYVFIESKRKARTKTMPVQNAETLLDDVSYIQEIKHLHGAVGIAFWNQYDVLLAEHLNYSPPKRKSLFSKSGLCFLA